MYLYTLNLNWEGNLMNTRIINKTRACLFLASSLTVNTQNSSARVVNWLPSISEIKENIEFKKGHYGK